MFTQGIQTVYVTSSPSSLCVQFSMCDEEREKLILLKRALLNQPFKQKLDLFWLFFF